MKKIEASKKIIIFLSSCFILALVYGIAMFTYSVVRDKSIDFTFLITIVTTTGAALCGAVAFYYNKAKMENVYKIKKSFLQEKYNILKKSGILTIEYAQQELMDEVQSIDAKLNEEEEKASVDTETNLNIEL